VKLFLSLFTFFLLLFMHDANAVTGQRIPLKDNPKIVNGPGIEKLLPSQLQGIWSWPDCTAGKRIVVFSSRYTLFMRLGVSHLGALQTWRQEEDNGEMLYDYATNNNNRALMKLANDGLMKIMFVAVHPDAALKSGWSSRDDQTAQEFAHCAKLFDSKTGLGQDEVNTPFLLDEAYAACSAVKASNFKEAAVCHKALFNVADTDKNNTLDATELRRISKQVAFAAASSVYCGGIPYPADTDHEAEEFAEAALGGEKFITFEQAVAKFSDPLFVAGAGLPFMKNAATTQILLPFIPAGVPDSGCPLVDPGNMRNQGTVLLPSGEETPTP